MEKSKARIYKTIMKRINNDEYKYSGYRDRNVNLLKLNTIGEIITNATKLEGEYRRITGIYFLFCTIPITNRLELIYVGQSTNIVSRVGSHTETKNFDLVYYIECPINLLDQVERRYIQVLHPSDNIQRHIYRGD